MNTERKSATVAEIESEIMGIRQQVWIAHTGRLGVREGGTMQCILDTLAETEAWRVDPEWHGEFAARIQDEKDKAVAKIREHLALAEAKAKADAEKSA